MAAPTQKKYALLALVTLCVCILALYIHRHREGKTGQIDSWLISFSGALQKNVFFLGRGGRTLFDHYVFLANEKKKNEALERELEYLRTKLAALTEVERQNLRFRQALGFKEQWSHELIAAHVVAHDVSSDYFGVRVDRGSEDGVEPGMGVISPSGLVGRVLRVSAGYADVVTAQDPASQIDVVIQRSRVRGILSGRPGDLGCQLKYVDKREDVRVQDTVVASGFGNVFPQGLLVGYVVNVTPDRSGVVQNIAVKTAVDLYRLEEVFIVRPPREPQKTAQQS